MGAGATAATMKHPMSSHPTPRAAASTRTTPRSEARAGLSAMRRRGPTFAIAASLVACTSTGSNGRRVTVSAVASEAVSAPSASVSASAQGTIPAAPPTLTNAEPLQRAEAMTFETDVAHETSCSQSFESSRETATYTLTLTPPTTARLDAKVHYASTFGPSPGRYLRGDHDFTSRDEDHAYAWSGHAGWVGDRLTIVFDGATTCEVPAATRASVPCAAVALQAIACATIDLPVLPATPAAPRGATAAKETATTTQLLRCDGEPAITRLDLEPADRVGLLFHAGVGLRYGVSRGFLASYDASTPTLRFAK